MALDYMACVSTGIYPTPGVTTTRRVALGVSFGLLNITLPESDGGIVSQLLDIGRKGIVFAAGLLRVG